ncbi:MAG: saccharopine dehydrogenase NADP-binding domain-containing protein [Bacteroidetes bacterium]|nr:saccharopine dehydrogenase NADP-binding domain-containing protein [Bacteroidota bacterium]
MKRFLLYGAYGYTGKLIAHLAADYGLTPILAGRSEEKLKELSNETGFDYKAFDLSDTEKLHTAMKEVDTILHCAGPFINTFEKVVEACLETGTHYLDITGEVDVFEPIKKADSRAREKQIMLLPGIGFDVVPSDCLAVHLKNSTPDAESLTLAIFTKGGISHGTAISSASRLGQGAKVRKGGELIAVPYGYKVREFDFDGEKASGSTYQWGDLSTAYHSTGIPNIETFMTNLPISIGMLKMMSVLKGMIGLSFVQQFIQKQIKKRPAGPSEEARDKGYSMVWGEVLNAKGEKQRAVFKGPEAYTLTAHTSLMALKKINAGEVKPGYQTPSAAFGKDFILELAGTEIKFI